MVLTWRSPKLVFIVVIVWVFALRLSAIVKRFQYRSFSRCGRVHFPLSEYSSEWIFVGYSLPEADFEFRHLLKAAEKAAPGGAAKKVEVVLKNDAEAALRFKRFFGLADEQVHCTSFRVCEEAINNFRLEAKTLPMPHHQRK